MAASALAETHTVALAYRREVVGARVAVPGTRLPFLAPYDPWTYRGVLALARRMQADVLIPTKRRDYLIAGLVARALGCRCVCRLGIVRRLPSTPWHRLVYGQLPDGIVVNAHAVKEALMAAPFIDPDRVEVIYNGLDFETMDRAVPQAAPFPVTVVTAGRLTRRKNQALLIEALRRLVRSGRSDIGVVLAGDGPLRRHLERVVGDSGLSHHVRFAGMVQDPYPVLASAHVYAATSTNEGLSNALLEGMYLTGAVVSTRAGGSGEIITDGENGLIVPDGDASALAECLSRLADDRRLRERLAARARDTVLAHCHISVMRDRLAAFLQRLAA